MDYKDNVLNCLGHFPDKTELNCKVEEQVEYKTHILQTVYYNVEQNERVKAYVLLPKNLKDKNPAIIACHQHAGEYNVGKSQIAGLGKDSMYHYGLDLCLKGYVVLCPDHLGFEDRLPQLYNNTNNKEMNGAYYERLIFCKYLVMGSSLKAKYLWDLCRGVDLLQSLEFVDADRIGAIGHSLGGQETLWLAWYDGRIKAAVASCGFSQIRNILRDGINHNLAMFSYGFLETGDISNLVCDMAPKPFLMINGKKDYLFPLDGVCEIAQAAHKSYSEKGYADNFQSILIEEDHVFPLEAKEQAYDWLDRHLKNNK